jgi:(R,R)-butanediol dehydrogenase/meso-butanediol dehydrogenase/diacetyl reductase
MKAAVFHGAGDVRVEDVPEPVVRPGTVKIAVSWCGICGTDLHEYHSGPVFVPTEPHPVTGDTLPVVMGHEFSGTVVEIADDVTGLAVGDRVAVEPVLSCGRCPGCRRGLPNLCRDIGFHGISGGGGGLAERTVVPASAVHVLPPDLDDEQGALVEPMAVGFHAGRVAGLTLGDTVLVLGAGPIGLVTLLVARAAGARRVVVSEVSPARRERAGRLGADAVLDPRRTDVVAEVRRLTGDAGADVALDCAGTAETWDTALAATRVTGTVVSVAVWEKPIETDLNRLVLTEQRVTGSVCYAGDDFPTTIALMADGRLPTEHLVTRRIALDDVVAQGFEELLAHRDRQVKILVRP